MMTIYDLAADESYRLMPESCPVVSRIFKELIEDEGLRESVFDEIHILVTSKFRSALTRVLREKHEGIGQIKEISQQMKEMSQMLIKLQTAVRSKGDENRDYEYPETQPIPPWKLVSTTREYVTRCNIDWEDRSYPAW
jgi:hypothetical protein